MIAKKYHGVETVNVKEKIFIFWVSGTCFSKCINITVFSLFLEIMKKV